MKVRLVLPFALAVAVAAVVGLVSAGSSSGQGAPYDSVSGAVKVTFPNFPPGQNTTEQLVVTAQDGPEGLHGSIEFMSPLDQVDVSKADVTCMRVDGNEALVGGTFREPFIYGGQPGFPASRLLYIVVQLRDNGAPGQSVPDEVHPVVFDDRPRQPNFSPCNIPPQVWYPVDKGNFAVHDATN
jgi:hypothetical protein